MNPNRPAPIAIRLTRDYINDKRDKRRSTGFHSMPVIKAGTFGVFVPMWDYTPATITLYTSTEHLHAFTVPYEFVSYFNPNNEHLTCTVKTEPVTPGEVLAVEEWQNHNFGYILQALYEAGKITGDDVRAAVRATRELWDREEKEADKLAHV